VVIAGFLPTFQPPPLVAVLPLGGLATSENAAAIGDVMHSREATRPGSGKNTWKIHGWFTYSK